MIASQPINMDAPYMQTLRENLRQRTMTRDGVRKFLQEHGMFPHRIQEVLDRLAQDGLPAT